MYLPHVEIKRRLSMHLKNLHRMWWRKFTDKIEIPSLFKHFPIIIEYINWIDVITRGRGPRRAPSTRCWAGWSWWGRASARCGPPAPPSPASSSSGHGFLFVSWHEHPAQDTIYYKWASVAMTLKFHFLWSTLFWLEESVSALYSDWLRGKSEANSCSWSVKTNFSI